VSAPNVAYCRELRLGKAGRDVRGHKRAVARAFPDLYPWPSEGDGFTDLFGSFFEDAVRKAQKRMGLAVDGRIGPATHEALERRGRKGFPGQWAFDATAILLCRDYCSVDPILAKRRKGVEFAQLMNMARGRIDYSQKRPFDTLADLLDADWDSIDCSGFATRVAEYAGFPNPNVSAGRRLTYAEGQGYTGTLIAGTMPTTLRDLRLLDLVLYGFTTASSPAFPYGSPTHVAVVVDLDPLTVCSMGNSAGPSWLPLFYRTVNARTPFRTLHTS
jgi:hypothetical protein